MFSDQIEAANPKRVWLANIAASSGVLNVIAETTGPKISSRITDEAGSTSTKSEGAK